MIEDPGFQDPLSLRFTEDFKGQNLVPLDSKKSPASPDARSETPEIHVIIKEEEEGWTVSDNMVNTDERLSSGEREDTCTRLPLVDGKERFLSYEGTRNKPVHVDESDGSSWGEGEQRGRLVDSDERTFCPGIVAAHRRITKAKARGRKRKMKSLQQSHVADELLTQDRTVNLPQSTSAQVEQWETAGSGSSISQSVSAQLGFPPSLGSKMSCSHLGEQSLCLAASVEAERSEEEERDEEIGGLINSDGEVVGWDAKDSPDQDSLHKDVFLPKCQLHEPNERVSSPTLIMEVVEDNDARPEEEENNRVVTVAAASSLHCGKRPRRKKTSVTLDESESETVFPVKRRSQRKIVEASASLSETLVTEGEVARRTRRKIKLSTLVRSQEFHSKSLRPSAAKRPYRRRKGTKQPAEHSEENAAVSAGKKRPGRKMLCVPLEIPPELLKKPKEKIEYHCSVCGKEFPHAYKLERHELIHTGEKPYCCSVCGRGFNQKGNLKTHYKVHFGGKDAVELDHLNPVQSEFCEYLKSLPGESKIRSSLHCLECGKKCESQSALQAHHITTHGEVAAAAAEPEAEAGERASTQLLFCRRCNIQFSGKEKLQEHMKSHVKEKRYPCPDCGKRFINESYIQVHQRIHTGEKPFLCSQCGRAFHTASSLKLHEMQHSGERPFACSLCGKTFRINSYLTAHYQTHIKDRPFICSVCGKGYSRAEELKVHQRLHTGERPYECAECGKSFIYRQGLRQHQRTHEGRRIGPTRQLGRPKQEVRPDV